MLAVITLEKCVLLRILHRYLKRERLDRCQYLKNHTRKTSVGRWAYKIKILRRSTVTNSKRLILHQLSLQKVLGIRNILVRIRIQLRI
jgi:hypothetical protein